MKFSPKCRKALGTWGNRGGKLGEEQERNEEIKYIESTHRMARKGREQMVGNGREKNSGKSLYKNNGQL